KASPDSLINSLSINESESILAIVEELLGEDSKEKEHQQALKLATIGLSLPHRDKAELIKRLLALPVPIQSKYNILATVILSGQIVSGDLIMEGVKDIIEMVKKKYWGNDTQWLIEKWLALLPFSDKPKFLLEAIDLVGGLACPIRHMHSLFNALQYAPGEKIESILFSLARRDTNLIVDHPWLSALVARRSSKALIQLLELLCDPSLDKPQKSIDIWWLVKALSGFLDTHKEFRTDLLNFYKKPEMKECHEIIEQLLAESPDNHSIISMVEYYAEAGKHFDGLFKSAIENICLEKRPIEGSPNTYELYSVDTSELRKRLFALVIAKGSEMPVAVQCLTVIDQIRDRYGHLDFEPRHPDIENGTSWPIIMT
ncbi:MAG: hypothetical protein ABSC11_10220, partial [Smithella sp.]